MRNLANQTLTILQSLIAHRYFWIVFGRYADRAYITDGSFMTFMSVEEQENIMLKLKLRPQPGTYRNGWVENDGDPEWLDRTPSAEEIRQAIPDLAAPRQKAIDTWLHWGPIESPHARLYLADRGMVLIDSLYAPLLMGPLYTHGPWDRLALWTEDHNQVGSLVLRLKDGEWARPLRETLAQLSGVQDRDTAQKKEMEAKNDE